jgi:hypothetical protein
MLKCGGNLLLADWLKNKGVIYVESRKGRRKT